MWRVLFSICAAGVAVVTPAASDSPPERSFELPEVMADYTSSARPKYFESTDLDSYDTTPEDNPLTNAGATLGRVLFYDTALSANHTVSCGSCHVQRHAFADPRPVSVGFSGQKTDRNAMALNDLRFVRAGFFWDERAESLEQAVVQPLFSHVEMGLNEPQLIERISNDQRYTPLFEGAFATPEVSTERVVSALAQFLRAMESYQSKFDQAAGDVPSMEDDFPAFTKSENLGKTIFLERCAACHQLGNGPHRSLFAMFRSLNNGVDADGTVRDGGRGDVTFDPSEVGSFKASSLRNVEYTAPYMHDGRFATLEDVVEHYSSGVQRHPNLGPVVRFQFSVEEKKAIVDFLKTLSDPHFIADPRFSDPWRPAPPQPAPPALATLEPQPPTTPDDSSDGEPWTHVLSQGQGISADATLSWLHTLDTDGDGQLSRHEVEPAVDILQLSGGFSSRSRTRSAAALIGREIPDGAPPTTITPNRVTPSRVSNATSAPVSSDSGSEGDFNGDGRVDNAEHASLEALNRFIELAGGGRLDVFLDRLLARFELTPENSRSARAKLKAAKVRMADDIRQLDLAICDELAREFQPHEYRALQRRVVNRLADARAAAPIQSVQRQQAEQVIGDHDRNEDDVLDKSELPQLARTLAMAPGGFGQLPPSGVTIDSFLVRIQQFDENADGMLSFEELPERMRTFVINGDADKNNLLTPQELTDHLEVVAFERLVSTGIYIGGGFANTLVHSRGALDEMELDPGRRARAHELIRQHQNRIDTLVSQTTIDAFEVIQNLFKQQGNDTTLR